MLSQRVTNTTKFLRVHCFQTTFFPGRKAKKFLINDNFFEKMEWISFWCLCTYRYHKRHWTRIVLCDRWNNKTLQPSKIMKEKHLILTFLGDMIARARRISIVSALLYIFSAAMLGVSSFSLLLFFRGNKEEAIFGLIASGFLAVTLFLWSLRHWFRDSSYLW